MENSIKTRLEKKQIEQLVKVNFPQKEVQEITEIIDGNICSVYIIQMTDIQTVLDGCQSQQESCSRVVLKVGMKADIDCLRYERDLFPTEYNVYQILANIEIPIPKIIKADFSCNLIPAGYFFMEFIDGKTWNKINGVLETQERAQLMKQLGNYYAQISSIKGNYFGYLKDDEQYHFQSHREAFEHMMQDILLDGKEHGIGLPYREIETVLYQCRFILDEIKEPRLVDFDLWAGNVFIRKYANQREKTEIIGIIDFGHCFYGDAYAAFVAAVHLFEEIENEPDFIEGYESVTKEMLVFTDHDRIRMDLYRLYLNLICMVETYRYEEGLAKKVQASFLRKIEKLLKRLQLFLSN